MFKYKHRIKNFHSNFENIDVGENEEIKYKLDHCTLEKPNMNSPLNINNFKMLYR